MYHERGMRQPQIAAELGLSQPRVSRLLRQAGEIGIVRTVVTMPPGTYTELEEEIQNRYGLRDVVVVDADGSGGEVIPALGAATAAYLDVSLIGRHVIGVSSWSETLLAAVDLLRPKATPVAEQVIQLLGGTRRSRRPDAATRLTGRLADLLGAVPVFLAAPGLVATATARKAILNDPSVGRVAALFRTITDSLVGIGSLEPSPLLRRSGNIMGQSEQDELRSLGAVGDVCFRYFSNADGDPVHSRLEQRLIGISYDELMAIPRRIGVAGGERKFSAIRGALRGKWVNVFITDLAMARRLAADAG